MKQTSMILMSDYYKQAHAEQYPKGITKLISYATARMSRIPSDMCGDSLVVFGIQSYIKDFLIERFNETFFNVPLEQAMVEYNDIIGDTFPIDYVNTGKFEALHKLGYLPVEICCLPEGTRVPIRSAYELPEGQCQVPFMSIVNTHPDFPWITEFLESVTSSEVWYPMAIANQAFYYRQIVNKWYEKTGCSNEAKKSAISEFGFRGGEGSEAAVKASSAFLTSFNKTATIPAIKYIHDYYGDPVNEIGSGMISTEHSVMCSNFAVDNARRYFDFTSGSTEENLEKLKNVNIGSIIKNNSGFFMCIAILDGASIPLISDIQICNGVTTWYFKEYNAEEVFIRKLLSKVYPTGNVSIVMDTYDYWANLQHCGVTAFKDHLDLDCRTLKPGDVAWFYHNGAAEFIGEVKDTETVDCDNEIIMYQFNNSYKFRKLNLTEVVERGGNLKDLIVSREGTVFFRGDSGDPVDIICGVQVPNYTSLEQRKLSRSCDPLIFVDDEQCWYKFRKGEDKEVWDRCDKKPVEVLGTVELLWEMFGGTFNEAGYRVLDSHVRAIYGDSITPKRAEEIYSRLAEKGFAACNVALGAGSFSTQCAEDSNGRLLPFTRDTYGIAVKATWCMDENTGEEYQIFKNPKTDTGKFKKSQKGLIVVERDDNGYIIAKDGYTTKTIPSNKCNLLQPVFRDGKMLKETTLNEVRQRLHNNNF